MEEKFKIRNKSKKKLKLRSKENDKNLINNLKQLNFNFNVKQNCHLTITVKT